jgi:hypothetical protein
MGRTRGFPVAHVAHCILDGASLMTTSAPLARACAASLLLVLAACQKGPLPAEPAAPAVWPASLPAFGEGFPNPGDPCRNVGESAATINFLDHTAWLVGCLSADDAAKLGGTVVATVDGVTLVSVPR